MKSEETESRRKRLESIVKCGEKALIAFSGGVDSSYLAYISHRVLGDNMLAVTAAAPWIARREVKEAEDLARQYGFPHRIIKINFSGYNKFFENPQNRCYFCKIGIFSKLKELSVAEGYEVVFEGSNADDASAYRPGIRAITELGIISPLKEAGLTKQEIRELSKEAGLPTADKPAYACLASRFPYGTVLTPEGFDRVEKAEDYLFSLGFTGLRVRDHFPTARIELPEDSMEKFLNKSVRAEIIQNLKSLGYRFITLDLEGYRTGCFDPVEK